MKLQLSINEVVALTTLPFHKFCSNQHPDEVALLAEIAKRLPSDATYLEVGTRYGHSAITVALANLYLNPVFCVDILPECKQWLKATIEKLNQRASVAHTYYPGKWELDKRIKLMTGDSRDIAEKWDREIDFLYIDGNHSYDEVVADIEAWTPFLMSGAYLGFHDYEERTYPKDWGVPRAVNEYILPDCKKWKLCAVAKSTAIFQKR